MSSLLFKQQALQAPNSFTRKWRNGLVASMCDLCGETLLAKVEEMTSRREIQHFITCPGRANQADLCSRIWDALGFPKWVVRLRRA
jgi:hypothetical protein